MSVWHETDRVEVWMAFVEIILAVLERLRLAIAGRGLVTEPLMEQVYSPSLRKYHLQSLHSLVELSRHDFLPRR